MWRLLQGYLSELLSFLKDDSTVLGFSIMGENDPNLGPDWVNMVYDFVKSKAPRHLVVLEQGGDLLRCPGGDPSSLRVYKPASDGGVGYRTYSTHGLKTDLVFAVNARFYAMARPSYLGEVCSGPGWEGTFIYANPDFITKLRDNMWISFLLQQPMALSWSAVLVEAERRIPTKIARSINWNKVRRAKAPVAVVVERPNLEQLRRLVLYEEALSSIPVDCDYIRPSDPKDGYLAVFDARRPFVRPELGRNIPPEVERLLPLRVSKGNHTTYLLSGDRSLLVAYVRNAVHYRLGPGHGHGVLELHRRRTKPREVRIELKNFPFPMAFTVYDLDRKAPVLEGAFLGSRRVDLGRTKSDFALFVRRIRSLPQRAFVEGVPYIPQTHPNTCGASALAMALRWAGIDISEGDIVKTYPKIKRTGFYIPWLWEFSGRLGLKTEHGQGHERIVKWWLCKGRPVIVFQFSDLKRRRPHFRVVIGYDEEKEHFIVHDPAPQLGPNYAIPYALFERLWKLPFYQDKRGERRRFYFVVIERKPGRE
ncbi:MAG TPA: hypothetical protein EYP65_08255 [Armatimonadetes bacterium]|nr:hypothetical protein [Armatimonadota bacterium]